jgi:hypothetical protein
MASLEWNMQPSRPGLLSEDPQAYWAEFRAQLDAAIFAKYGTSRAIIGPEENTTDDGGEVRVTVTEPSVAVSLAELPAGPKAVLLAVLSLGWEAKAWRSRTYSEPTLFKSTSETHNAGDVRFPAKERRVYFVTAKSPKARLGFTATWSGIDDSKKVIARRSRGYSSAMWLSKADEKMLVDEKNASFVDAKIYDPVGVPVEMRAEYKPSRYMIDTFGESDAKRAAGMRDYDYNDGTDNFVSSKFMRTTAEFNQWLDDWLDTLQSDHKRLSRAPAVKAAPPPKQIVDAGMALLDATEWSYAE